MRSIRIVFQTLAILLGIWVCTFFLVEWAPGGDGALEQREMRASIQANRALKQGLATELRSPVGGVVESLLVEEGQELDSGEPVVRMKSGDVLDQHEGGIVLSIGVAAGNRIQETDTLLVLRKPMVRRMAEGLIALVQLDLGRSWSTPERTVWECIGPALRISLGIGGSAWCLAIVLAFWIGMWGATGSIGRGWAAIEALFLSLSTLVLAPVVAWIFQEQATDAQQGWWLAVLVLGSVFGVSLGKILRTSIDSTRNVPAVLAARARGVHESTILIRYILPPALSPVLGILGPSTASLLCGSVVVERVFNLPGVSYPMVDAALARDMPVVLGIGLVYSALLLMMNGLAEWIQDEMDPRGRDAEVG